MGGEAVSGGRQSERDGGQSWRSGRALLPMLCSSCMEIPSRLRGGGQVRWASMPAGRATPSSSCSSPSSEARAAARHQAENEHGCGLAEMKAAAAGALVEKARENHLCTTGQ